MGAAIKQLIRRAILHNKILTSSGYITSAAEVAEHLRNHFTRDEWQKAHQKTTVNEVVVLYSDALEMEERAEVEKYKVDSLVGQMSTFSYAPLDVGVVAGREGSCWCQSCFGMRGRGVGTADSNLCVAGCRCGSANPWREQEVQRGDALGIAERRTTAQKEGRRVSRILKPHQWLASQDRIQDDVLWVGQGAKLPPGIGEPANGACVFKTVSERSEIIGGTTFTRGDVAVAVKWWTKSDAVGERDANGVADADAEERTYEEWEPTPADIAAYGIMVLNGETNQEEVIFVLNATELRKINFQMDALHPVPAPRTHFRRSCNSAHATPDRPDAVGRRFRMPAQIENEILALCS